MPKSGCRALRRNRWSQPGGGAYLITTATAHRRPIFTSLAAGRCVVHALRKAQHLEHASTLAFVVMPDHFHWLLELGHIPLSRAVGGVMSSVARQLRNASGMESVWQKGFHDHAIRGDEDLAAAARYIVMNPVRAGLVRRVGDYPLWDAVWL